ncbi:MAG TPA: hypothetical protein VGE68_08575, partial [Sphingomicrobium sp.]
MRIAQLHERLGEEQPATERWAAVLALSSAIGNPPPELAEILRHANEYVGARKRKVADAIDRVLADELPEATGRERHRMRTAADAWLGRRPIYTNHCEGLHYP